MDERRREYMHVRGILEEHNSNLRVEDFVVTQDRRAIWIIFDSESDITKIPTQVQNAAKDFKLSVVIFRIGKSFQLIYLPLFRGFFPRRVLDKLADNNIDIMSLQIPDHKLLSALKSLVIEDKRSKICDASTKTSPARTYRKKAKEIDPRG